MWFYKPSSMCEQQEFPDLFVVSLWVYETLSCYALLFKFIGTKAHIGDSTRVAGGAWATFIEFSDECIIPRDWSWTGQINIKERFHNHHDHGQK